MHHRTLGWLLITPLWAACAAREPATGAQDAGASSTPAPAAPAGTGVAQPLPPPADTPTGTAAGAAGIRAPPENDAPPRTAGPARPLQPPPTLDGKRTAPVPPLDRSQTPVPLPPKGPANEKTSPADR